MRVLAAWTRVILARSGKRDLSAERMELKEHWEERASEPPSLRGPKRRAAFCESQPKTETREGIGTRSERQLDFEEFLTFFHKFCFSEEARRKRPVGGKTFRKDDVAPQVLISRQERELRRLARKHGISFLDIDWLKKEFDKAQSGKSRVVSCF